MIAMTTAGALWATLALQAGAPAPPLDLFCRGRGDRFENNQRVPFDTAVRLKVVNGKGQALIPDDMLAPDDARGWHEVKNLRHEDGAVSGKVYFSWIFSPVMTWDRDTNVLNIRGSLANFSGTCGRYDPATSRIPPPSRRAPAIAAAPRAPAPGYAPARPAPAYAPAPAGGDARAAARAMAARSTARATAQSSALKADLAFRLFNASPSTITEFVMLSASGVPSGNWLKAGERLAPQAFRAMNFAVGTKCTHTVRITFADQSRAVRPINFCGKNILYADKTDVWAE